MNSKHPDEAAKFLDYYYTQETVSLMYKDCSTAPAPIHLEPDTFTSAGVDPRTADLYVTFAEETGKGNYGYTSWTFMTKEMSTVVNQSDVDLLMSGEITAEEWAKKLDDAYQAGVKDNIIPPVPPRQ